VRRLLPAGDPIEVTVAEAYTDVPGGRPRPVDRPWVTVLMISTADGAIAIDGRSGGLGNDGDRAVYRTVRGLGDAVLVGAATVRAEIYRPLAEPRRLFVVSGSGDIGSDELLAAATTTIVMPSAAAAPSVPPGGAGVLRAGHDRVDVADALRSMAGVGHVVCEGGPSLIGQVLAAGCADEICLSFAPRFVAGDSGRLATGPTAPSEAWTLAHVLADDEGFLFLRYLRAA
jgi:riboflavin biosynthesis pyrimidine reductase